MRKGDIGTQPDVEPSGSSGYVRFVVLSGPRTGSHMLAQALNSSPHITCFREVFNGLLDFIQFGVEGYDDFSSRDLELRKADPVGFLHERIFCRWPKGMQAVGFKYHYDHVWAFPGVVEELVRDRDIKVLHLRRRNLLRVLVSLKLAEQTGVWLQAGTKMTRANLLKAIRHPLKAIGRVRRNLQLRRRPTEQQRARVKVTPDELLQYSVKTDLDGKNFDELLNEHEVLPVYYEDFVDSPETAYGEVQSFLGVDPVPLEINLRRQNPQPLPELIENYDELREVLKESPVASAWD